jgi:hypothetical protein
MEGEASDVTLGRPVTAPDRSESTTPVSISTQVIAYASSDADALGFALPLIFARGNRGEQISVAADIVELEREAKGWKMEPLPVSAARGVIRMESWEASASANIPVESWPRLRDLAHRPLRNLDPEKPEIGEVRINASKDIWKSFKDAARAAVAWLGRQLGISLPGQGIPRINSKPSMPEPSIEVKPYVLTPEMLDAPEVPPAMPALGPYFETPEETDARERKMRVGQMKPDIGVETYQTPRWKLPGRR